MSLTEESLATARARHAKNVRRCQGGCGRDTRSSKVPKHLFPDTVLRSNATHCTTCLRDEKEVALKAEGKPVPPRGGGTPKELSEERLASLRAEAEKFTADRRARLARQERLELRHRMVQGPVRINMRISA